MSKPVPAPGRQVPCERCPLRPLQVFRNFTPEELAFVSAFKSAELTAEPGTTLLMQGANSPHLYTLLSGWAFRYKTLPDGRRQISISRFQANSWVCRALSRTKCSTPSRC